MKLRMGFVSNSSSSSFCIYGIMLPYGFDLGDKFRQELVKF